MNSLRATYHIARADFLERVRRYSFLGTLTFAVYLSFLTAKGEITIRLGEWRGQSNSAWVGTLLALVATTFISLAGFYIVSSSIKRDEQTRVGRILAATPMSRLSYLIAKAISNFAVLVAMVGVLAIAAVPLQLLRGEERHLEILQLLKPFFIFALPLMAMVAALAVLFEATPVLRSAAGSVVIFFVWIAGIISSEKLRNFDLFGIGTYMCELTRAVRAFDPAYKDGFVLGFDAGQGQATKVFVWNGASFSSALIAGRLFWIVCALMLVALAAIWFHRFDPARCRSEAKSTPNKPEFSDAPRTEVVRGASNLTTLPVQTLRFAAWRLVRSELLLLVARRHWSLYLLSGGLFLAGLLAPLDIARRFVLAAIWILPAFLLSRTGARDDLFSTRALLWTAPNAASRQLLCSWIAAALVPLLLSFAVGVRLIAKGDLLGFIAMAVGALFVSGLAHGLGALTRTPKAFEAVYILWWYVGPVNLVPGCDFYGATADTARPFFYACLGALLLGGTWLVRRARMLYA